VSHESIVQAVEELRQIYKKDLVGLPGEEIYQGPLPGLKLGNAIDALDRGEVTMEAIEILDGLSEEQYQSGNDWLLNDDADTSQEEKQRRSDACMEESNRISRLAVGLHEILDPNW
jgi:hypothetical protein